MNIYSAVVDDTVDATTDADVHPTSAADGRRPTCNDTATARPTTASRARRPTTNGHVTTRPSGRRCSAASAPTSCSAGDAAAMLGTAAREAAGSAIDTDVTATAATGTCHGCTAAAAADTAAGRFADVGSADARFEALRLRIRAKVALAAS